MLRRIAIALLPVLAAGATVAVARAGEAEQVPLRVAYSRFLPDELHLKAGQTVTFVIENSDPIDHEFILGDEEVQDRHETGIEPHHDAVPTEVSLPAGETVRTTVTFDRPGELVIGCHLPGHYAYGMRAAVVVSG